jgi:hypothetical protein
MPGRSSKTRSPEAIAAQFKRLGDLRTANQKRRSLEHGLAANAARTVDQPVGERAGDGPRPDPPDRNEGKNPHAVALGKLGGAKGGKARAEALTPGKRKAIAKAAAKARWS